jgi:hypothetical protein
MLTLVSLEPRAISTGAAIGPRLRDAPAMAELLNLISVVGLLEQLAARGSTSARSRRGSAHPRLTLSEGTAVGPSLGVSMDGVYDTASRRFDMQGVSRRSTWSTGSSARCSRRAGEGLFGFSYRLTGTASHQRHREPAVDPDPGHLPRDLPPPAARD